MNVRQTWTPERVVAEIRRLSVDGVAPCSGRHAALCGAARHHFGSWAAACEVAGVRVRRPGERDVIVTPEVVERRVRWLKRRPHLRFRLRVFAMALERGLMGRGGDNPFRGWESVAS